MKFAIGLPNCREGVFYRPQISTVEKLVELTQLAERLGYDAIWGADFMAPVAQMGSPETAKPDWYELMVIARGRPMPWGQRPFAYLKER